MKTKERLEKEQEASRLFNLLDNKTCLESIAALHDLLKFPKDFFSANELKRLSSCGNKKFEAFAILFQVKNS